MMQVRKRRGYFLAVVLGIFPTACAAGGAVARLLTFGLVGCLIVGLPGIVEAQRYTFTKIADTSGPFSGFGGASINAGGIVAFSATLDTGGTGIFAGDGGPLTTVADTTGDPFFSSAPSINASGTVAFRTFLTLSPCCSNEGIFTGSGGPVTTLYDTSGPFSNFGTVTINDVGTVAFFGCLDAGGCGIFRGNGGPTTTIDTGGGGGPFINNAGMVAFFKFLDGGGAGIFTGSGGALTTIADTTGPFGAFFTTSVSLNVGGTVAFHAILSPCCSNEGIFTGNGGPVTTIADSTGPFADFGTPSINSSGKVAFSACLDAGSCGIFTGPNPLSDIVIATGDALFGSTVTSLGSFRGALNDAGQIAFFARLADGTSGIYRAEPLYDDFNAEFINPDKWFGNEFGLLEEAIREIRGGQLHLANRSYGNTNFDSGNRASIVRMNFTDPAAVTEIAATVTAKSFEASACATNPFFNSAQARLEGFFFNTATPIPGSQFKDVLASIRLDRRSDSTDPPDVLRVSFFVVLCNDGSCSAGFVTTLGAGDLGSVTKAQPVRLRIKWDQPNHQFIFQRDSEPAVVSPYAVSDAAPPGRHGKDLGVINFVPNCTSEPRPVGFMEALFDDVFVNQSALP